MVYSCNRRQQRRRGRLEQGWVKIWDFKKTDLYGFSPEQLEDNVSKQVLLEEAAVASILYKSAINFELKFQHYDTIKYLSKQPSLSSS